MNDKVYVGTERKWKITASATGFSLDTDDWNVTITRGKTSKTFQKDECVHGQDGWYVTYNTADFGAGMYYAVLTAYVPDNDFDDGTRTEVKKFDLEEVYPL